MDDRIPRNSLNGRMPFDRDNKSAPRDIKQVVDSDVKIKKKKGWSSFFTGDLKDAVDYLINDQFIPYTQRTILDALNNFASMIILGEPSSARRSSVSGYHNSYDIGRKQSSTISQPKRYRSNHVDIEEYIFDNRKDAEDALRELRSIIRDYGNARKSDFLAIVGKQEYLTDTDEKWGWYDVSTADVRPYRDGWILTLPDLQEV